MFTHSLLTHHTLSLSSSTMTTRRRDPVGSWWWAGGGGGGVEEDTQPGGGGEFTFGAMCSANEHRRRELAALGGYQLQEAAPQNQQEADSDIFQLSYPRPRLRWTRELHDQFIKAVDELGGANKATPKAILNLMGVEGLTLYHLKSHLQKFRLGKTGRKLWRKELIPPNYYPKIDDRLPPMNLEAQRPSMSNAFNRNGTNILGADAYGNLHLLVEPQPAAEKLEATAKISSLITNEVAGAGAGSATAAAIGGVKLEEELGAAKPALLPLFPACGMMEWSEYLEGGGRRSVENASAMDDYLNYSSSEFAHHSRMIFKSFFDEVATFSASDHANADLSVAHYYP